MEGMAILKRNHPLGGLTDVGDRTMGLQGQIGHFGRHLGKGRRILFAVDGHALACGVKTGQSPAVAMFTGIAAAAGQAAEGEGHVGGGIGAEGQQFTHAYN